MARQTAGDRDYACQMVQSGFGSLNNITIETIKCRAVVCSIDANWMIAKGPRGRKKLSKWSET